MYKRFKKFYFTDIKNLGKPKPTHRRNILVLLTGKRITMVN